MTVEEQIQMDLEKKNKKKKPTVYNRGAVVVELAHPRVVVAWFKASDTTVKRRAIVAAGKESEEEFTADWSSVVSMLTA